MTIYLQHHETGQLAKIKGTKLTVVRVKGDAFGTLPGKVWGTIYEITVMEIDSEYIEALCQTNISLGKREWEAKVTTLINTLFA
jgi:hypothetical protein